VVTPEAFESLKELLRRRTGVVLDDGKEYLVRARLGPVVRREGLGSIGELADLVRDRPDAPLSRRVIEALMTTETSFFRDVHPFSSLRDRLIPELVKKRAAAQALRFWSAACSTGQEPYSVGILLREYFPHLASWQVKILASDVSGAVLERARMGRYSQMEINRGVPTHLLVRYFHREGLQWEVFEDIRRMIDFREINLVEPWPLLPSMDVIFLRNVLIYFDDALRRHVLERIARQLEPDGYLFVGGAETMMAYPDLFERVEMGKSSCYRPRMRGSV